MCGEALDRVGTPSVIARLRLENYAYAAVATKLGMLHELDTTGRLGELVSVYRLVRDPR